MKLINVPKLYKKILTYLLRNKNKKILKFEIELKDKDLLEYEIIREVLLKNGVSNMDTNKAIVLKGILQYIKEFADVLLVGSLVENFKTLGNMVGEKQNETHAHDKKKLN